MTLKKMKPKKNAVQPISREKSMVVQSVQLPIATKVKAPKNNKAFWTILMTLLAACLLGWFVFQLMMVLHPATSVRGRLIPVRPALPPTEAQAPVKTYAQNVVAVVGDEEITIEELKEFVKKVPQLAEVPFNQIYPKMLDLYLNNKVVQLGAEEMLIPEDPEVQRMIQTAEEQIITQAYLTAVLEQAITEQDLQNFYNEQVKNFQPQQEIHARHILVDTQDQARDVLIQLKAGADFATLANQKSLDKNTEAGDLGYFTREMMIPEFAEAVFKMQKGELSNPVRTAYGWHVIQVLDKRMTSAPKFEDVKDQLRQAVMERKVPEILAEERVKRNVQIIRPTME